MRAVGLLASLVVRLLGWTLRLRVQGPAEPPAGPVIYAFEHGRQLGLLQYPRARGVAVLASLSRDGRLQKRILTRLGLVVADGSSSRGGAAGLRALVRLVRAGRSAAFAVDGPRGPRRRVKPGVIALARATGAPIVPLFFDGPAFVLSRTWDRYAIPRPFSRATITRGAPLHVAPDADLERTRAALERVMIGEAYELAP